MADSYERTEVGGALERSEPKFETAFHSAIECVKEGVGRQEAYERHALPVFELLFSAIEQRLEDVREFVHALGVSVRELEPVLGELAGKLGEGCDAAEASLKRGVEWLREHRDVLEAAAKLIVLVAVAVEAPELAAAMIKNDPSLLAEPLHVVVEAVANA